MATFTATAGSNSTIGYAQYGSTSWKVGTTNGAVRVRTKVQRPAIPASAYLFSPAQGLRFRGK